MFEGVEFANPNFFWLLLLLPVAGLWYYLKYQKDLATLRMPSTSAFGKQGILPRLKPALFVMRLLALAAIITALARPQT
ncbi:BatA domain-containing protein, partial [Zeaxanthinibacter enoshimensis]|uniref:BatA domain-containing protein n=1 Tax=Zeaxanthinibacter enoshimensis TaxID=392009 RepID=UPI003569541A